MIIKDFKDSLEYLFKAEVTPFVWGHAGIGKSSIVKQYALEKGYKFFPFYLGTQSDLGDVLGLADFVRDENGTAMATKFATPEWLKGMIDYCENNPNSGAVIFLDEFNRARRDILNGMFSLALDKTFHTLKLPKNCHIVAAGNPPTDEYYVTDVNETALMARFVHVKLEPSFAEWVFYAKERKLEPSLLEFLQTQPELLEEKRSEFELPVKIDRRSYERLSKLIALGTPNHLIDQLMVGIIGIERSVAYRQYLKTTDKPLNGDEVLNMTTESSDKIQKWSNPENMKISLLNLTCEALQAYLESSANLTDVQKGNLMSFFLTVPKDVTFPLVKNLVQKKLTCFVDFFQDKVYKDQMVNLIASAKGIKL